MRLARKTKTEGGIPTSSLPDIIFMLLIFFMVVTVLSEFQGLKLLLPEAKQIAKLEGKKMLLTSGPPWMEPFPSMIRS